MGLFKNNRFVNNVVSAVNARVSDVQDRRAANRTERREKRNERVSIRQGNRTDRVGLRVEGRVEKAALKYASHEVAYENGIDPKASMWKGVSDIVGSTTGAAASIFGDQKQAGMSAGQLAAQSLGRGSTMPLLLVVLLGLFFLFRPKSKTKKRNT